MEMVVSVRVRRSLIDVRTVLGNAVVAHIRPGDTLDDVDVVTGSSSLSASRE
jgi:hypothetical protein